MKSVSLLSLIAILFNLLPSAVAQQPLWTVAMGSESFDYIREVHTDASGNIIVCGTYQGEMTIDGITLPHMDGNEIFLLKFDPDGQLLWGQGFTGLGPDGGNGLATDDADNIYLAASYTTDLHVQGIAISNNSQDRDGILLKFDPDGTYLWSVQFGGNGIGSCRDVAWDDGTVYAVGSFFEEIMIDGQTAQSQGDSDMWIAGLSAANGNVLWADVYGDSGADRFNEIQKRPLGDIYVSGTFSGTVNFGNISVSDGTATEPLILQFAENGTPKWAVYGVCEGTSDDAYDLEVDDATGDVYVVGKFEEPISFIFNDFPAGSSGDGFILALDVAGNFRWAHTTTTGDVSAFYGAHLTSDRIFLTGSITNGPAFDGAADFSGLQDAAILVAAFDKEGNYVSELTFDSPSFDYGWDVSGSDEYLYLGASFSDDIMVGGESFPTVGPYDFFLSKLEIEPLATGTVQPSSAEPVATITHFLGTNEVAITLASADEGYVRLLSMDGQLINRRVIGAFTNYQIPDFLPAGSYVVSVSTRRGAFAKAITVVR